MKKMNNRGFALMEVLVVSTVIMVAFVAIFVNFYPLLASYEQRLSYNDIESKYALFHMRSFLLEIDESESTTRNNIKEKLDNSTKGYINIDENLVGDQEKYNVLKKALDIEEIIVTSWKTIDLKANYEGNDNMKKYIQTLPNGNDDSSLCRIIIRTKTGYANAKFDVDVLTYTKEFSEDEITLLPNQTKRVLLTLTNTTKNKNVLPYYSVNLIYKFNGQDYGLTHDKNINYSIKVYDVTKKNVNDKACSLALNDEAKILLLLKNKSNEYSQTINLNEEIKIDVNLKQTNECDERYIYTINYEELWNGIPSGVLIKYQSPYSNSLDEEYMLYPTASAEVASPFDYQEGLILYLKKDIRYSYKFMWIDENGVQIEPKYQECISAKDTFNISYPDNTTYKTAYGKLITYYNPTATVTDPKYCMVKNSTYTTITYKLQS